MYLGIDVHKRNAQVAVIDQAGEIVEEVRVENANLDELAQRYAGAQAALEATSNYYHIYDTLSKHLDVTVAHPQKLNQIADTDKKTDRVDAKELARMLRLNAVPSFPSLTDYVLPIALELYSRFSLECPPPTQHMTSPDATRVVVVTASGWIYAPRYLDGVLHADSVEIDSLVTVPPYYGTDDKLAFANQWVESFGIPAVLKHVFYSIRYSLQDLFYRVSGRGEPRSTNTLAKQENIHLHSTEDVNSSSFKSFLRSRDPDVLVSIAATQRFDADVRSIPDHAINVHSSLLPEYRGVMPAFWALRNLEEMTGVTVHYMDEILDAGEIIYQDRVPIESDDSLHSLNDRLANHGSSVLLTALEQIYSDTVDPTAVKPDAGSYHSFPDRSAVQAFFQAGNELH